MTALLEATEKDERIVHLLADSGEGLDGLFMHKFPDRMFNFGIAEQNMMGAAAGLALCGRIPFVFAQGAFLSYRAFEFLRNDICLQNANVKIIGTGCGMSLGTLGPSHHTTEDISVLRALPALSIMSVSSPSKVKKCVKEALDINGPVYIKLAMNGISVTSDIPCNTADGIDIYGDISGKYDILILSEGPILINCIEVCKVLADEGIRAVVADVWRLKSFNTALFTELLVNCKLCAAIEEHNVHGGLGSIVAEIIAGNGLGKKLLTVGLDDRFAVGYGTHAEVLNRNGLGTESICKKIMEVYEFE